MASLGTMPAQLDERQLGELRDLEKRLGKWVVAVEPPPRPADLTQDQLQQIQTLEQKLGVTLVAYEDR